MVAAVAWLTATSDIDVVAPARLEAMYSQLHKAFEDSKNEPGAADFHYGEMEMRRAGARGGERPLLWLYWLVSGYGLRAARAIIALALIIAAAAIRMKYAGLPDKSVAYVDSLLYGLRSAFLVEEAADAPG